ncbi:S1C family serine protease [Phenylobacterium aquaticum]|uniref:S1C family serine protease n=1 Tax=Phenylobacterium aquaticum TaxID=1763816 RepID=UPI001F5DD904|nr:S1C family serine protease [Phenylobacterium aquaticum]
MISDVKNGQVWGDLRFGPFCIPFGKVVWPPVDDEITQDELVEAFDRRMKAVGFGPRDRGLFDTPADMATEFAIGARVTSVQARVCGWPNSNGPTLWKGSAILAVEWQIYSRIQRRTVATISTKAGFDVSQFAVHGEHKALIAAFGENAKALAAAPAFREVFIAAPSDAQADHDRTTAKTPILIASLGQGRPPPISEATGSVVVVHASGGMGSAFLVSPDGYLLTNAHVVGTDAKVRVHWSDGFESEGEVVRVQKARDVALVRTGPHGRTPLPLRTAKATPGEAVFAIGAPLQEALQGTVTKGIVSANRILDGFSFIQSDVAVTHGNSGGPLLDEKGLVIGLTDLGYRPDGVPENINFFIPIGDALDFLNLKPAP